MPLFLPSGPREISPSTDLSHTEAPKSHRTQSSSDGSILLSHVFPTKARGGRKRRLDPSSTKNFKDHQRSSSSLCAPPTPPSTGLCRCRGEAGAHLILYFVLCTPNHLQQCHTSCFQSRPASSFSTRFTSEQLGTNEGRHTKHLKDDPLPIPQHLLSSI